MPLLDGFEVALRATPLLCGSDTTVLMMLTSSGAESDRRRASEIPVIQGYVIKPLTADTVRGILQAA
jgi:CheY-like chemotaxis protein